jgi:hypothetical protein
MQFALAVVVRVLLQPLAVVVVVVLVDILPDGLGQQTQ